MPFLTVDIELTNHCSQNCAFCPREKITRPFGFIDFDFLNRLLPQLKQIGSRVTFCGMGCPIIHPEFVKIMMACREIKGLNFGVTLQAPVIDRKTRQMLAETRPGFVEISFPTFDAELFAKIFPGQNLQSSLQNVEKLAAVEPKLRGITVVSVITAAEKFTASQIRDFWQRRNIACRITTCHSRGGNLENKQLLCDHRPQSIENCSLFVRHSFVTWQGHLLACCHDLSGETLIADLNRQTLKEAGEEKTRILNDKMPYRICSNCDEPLARLSLPDLAFPETASARKKFLRVVRSD